MAYAAVTRKPGVASYSYFRDLSIGQLFNFDKESEEGPRRTGGYVHVKVSDDTYVEGPFYRDGGQYCGSLESIGPRLHWSVNPLGMMPEDQYEDIAAHNK